MAFYVRLNGTNTLLGYASQTSPGTALRTSVALVRELFHVQAMHPGDASRWQKEAHLRDQLRGRLYVLSGHLAKT